MEKKYRIRCYTATCSWLYKGGKVFTMAEVSSNMIAAIAGYGARYGKLIRVGYEPYRYEERLITSYPERVPGERPGMTVMRKIYDNKEQRFLTDEETAQLKAKANGVDTH